MTFKIHYSFIRQTIDDGQVPGFTALFYVAGTLGLLGTSADSQACGLVLVPIAITDGPAAQTQQCGKTDICFASKHATAIEEDRSPSASRPAMQANINSCLKRNE